MDVQGFIRAKAQFPLEYEEKAFRSLEERRKAFVGYFTPNKIANMTIDEYVEGKGQKDNNFCYGIEIALKMLGNIQGSSAVKFGIYFSKAQSQYVFASRFGSNYIEAFENVRNSILELLNAGEKENLKAIIENPLAPTIKGKILSVYYPEIYLNIFSDEHLSFYLKKFDLLDEKLAKANAVYKRKALVKFKNDDPDMKSWSMNMFAVFLWKYFPKAPPSKSSEWIKKVKDQFTKDEESIRKGNFGFGGEGEQHRKLKEYIFKYPNVIGITNYKEKGMEHNLLSGDRLDVWFRLADGSQIAIEVKSQISSSADVLRGLFQCVKYRAIISAENLTHGEIHNNLVYLVLGGSLSKSNQKIRELFDITVFENIEAE